MRLATITNWAYGITVALSLASGAAMLLDNQAQENERTVVQQRHELMTQLGKLEQAAGASSSHAREYVITGDLSYRALYERATNLAGVREERLERLRKAGSNQSELEALSEVLRWAETLQQQQQTAIDTYTAGDRSAALQILFGPEYVREENLISDRYDDFSERLDQRTEIAVTEATRLSQWWSAVSQIMLVATMLVFLFVLYFVFKRRVLQPVVKLSDVVNRLAAQDFDTELPPVSQIDEIGDIASAIALFRENGLARQRLEAERALDLSRRELLGRMTQRLHGCETTEELAELVACFTPQLVPTHAGRLYLLDDTSNAVRQITSWGLPHRSTEEFAPGDCWALRRGLPHHTGAEDVDIPCPHIANSDHDTICLPLSAQRETLGLLYLESSDNGAAQMHREPPDTLLFMLAENIGLALANLRLREALREMAMIDPLTGLANRRGLESALEHAISTARSSAKPLSALMIDLDHFKRFNDTYGHEAGDLVLENAAEVFRKASREGDLVARFGGEEFLVLLPGLTAAEAMKRAELIRGRIATLDLAIDGRNLGSVSCSIGTATAPQPIAYTDLLEAADRALYRAKELGRDQVASAADNSTKTSQRLTA